MKFMIFYYLDENVWANASNDAFTQARIDHDAFVARALELGGPVVSSQGFGSRTAYKSLRRDGVADGPFVPGDQQIGAYYIVEARDLDHAVDVARELRFHDGDFGFEVRSMLDADDYPVI